MTHHSGTTGGSLGGRIERPGPLRPLSGAQRRLLAFVLEFPGKTVIDASAALGRPGDAMFLTAQSLMARGLVRSEGGRMYSVPRKVR